MNQPSTEHESKIAPVHLAILDDDLAYFHNQTWALRTGKLLRQLNVATGDARDVVQQQLDAHYGNRFKPETSRATILAQLEASAARRQHDREAPVETP